MGWWFQECLYRTTITLLAKKMKTPNRKLKGQKDVFEEIWNERPHFCVKCWKYLREAKAHNFSHIKPKWLYPELKFEKSNIELICFSCHYENTFWWKYNWISYD